MEKYSPQKKYTNMKEFQPIKPTDCLKLEVFVGGVPNEITEGTIFLITYKYSNIIVLNI